MKSITIKVVGTKEDTRFEINLKNRTGVAPKHLYATLGKNVVLDACDEQHDYLLEIGNEYYLIAEDALTAIEAIGKSLLWLEELYGSEGFNIID